MSDPHDRFDAIVIGAGHNGLVCAFYLARAGLRVVVLERSDRIGGAAITEEFFPGFKNSVASYTVSLLAPKVITDMSLDAHGLAIVPRPIANFVPALDGPGLELHHDVGRTTRAIRAFSQHDADRYPAFAAELDEVTSLLRPLLLEAPVNPFGGWRAWCEIVIRLPRLRRLLRRPRLIATLRSLLFGSAGDWLDRWFESDLLKGGYGFDAVVGHYASPYSPGSGYLLLHHALGQSNGIQGAWGHAIGGMGAVTAAMARAARRYGVNIRLEEPVVHIARERERLVVSTAAGRDYEACVVAGAIHPQTLFNGLMDTSDLPAAFRSRLGAWRSESASFRINVALAELPSFTARPGHEPAPHHGAGILISPSLEYLNEAYVDANAVGHSRAPVIELLIPSTVDASLAPAGRHVASLFCQHFPRHRADGQAWSAAGPAAIDAVIDTVTAYAPNFRASILGSQALSPEDLEQRFGLVGGDIFHGQMTLDQLYWARPAVGNAAYRSPVRGIYLCASGAHPGGGVSGAPGHNAAHAILQDLDRNKLRLGR